MLAYYHRKTEEGKKLDEVDEADHHMNSAWADSKNLKRSLHGAGGDIMFR
jgi:hypothetical protein